MTDYGKVILCNTTIQVMGTIGWQKAVTLVLSDKAVSIKDSDHVIHSPSYEMAVPEVIMLNDYVQDAHMYREINTNISKSSIRRRDNYVCAYCGGHGDTIDHVIPQSRGGKNTWDNLITSCYGCNNKKSDKLLSEIGWEMRYMPKRIFSRDLYQKEQDKVNTLFNLDSVPV